MLTIEIDNQANELFAKIAQAVERVLKDTEIKVPAAAEPRSASLPQTPPNTVEEKFDKEIKRGRDGTPRIAKNPMLAIRQNSIENKLGAASNPEPDPAQKELAIREKIKGLEEMLQAELNKL